MEILRVQHKDAFVFDGSLIQTKHVVLTNPSSFCRVTYRLMTAMTPFMSTSPTMGILERNESVDFCICMDQDGQEGDDEAETITMHHKVFVQAAIVNDNVIDIQTLWLELRTNDIWYCSIDIKIRRENSKEKIVDRLIQQVREQSKEMGSLINKGNRFVHCNVFLLTLLIILLAIILAIVYGFIQ